MIATVRSDPELGKRLTDLRYRSVCGVTSWLLRRPGPWWRLLNSCYPRTSVARPYIPGPSNRVRHPSALEYSAGPSLQISNIASFCSRPSHRPVRLSSAVIGPSGHKTAGTCDAATAQSAGPSDRFRPSCRPVPNLVHASSSGRVPCTPNRPYAIAEGCRPEQPPGRNTSWMP